MDINEIDDQLDEALDADDAKTFEKLLLKYPEFLEDHSEVNDWMRVAAKKNRLSVIKCLVKLGVDVNISDDPGEVGDTFYQPEGPILWAASNGNIDVVIWLLKMGAKINYVVNGMPRCLPLIYASTEGHFNIVKILVEHGANVHAVWNGLNAAKQAERYGHTEIRDYLIAQPKNSNFESQHQSTKLLKSKKPLLKKKKSAPKKTSKAKKKKK